MGFVKAIDGLGQGIVVTISHTANGIRDAALSQTLAVADRQILTATITGLNEIL